MRGMIPMAMMRWHLIQVAFENNIKHGFKKMIPFHDLFGEVEPGRDLREEDEGEVGDNDYYEGDGSEWEGGYRSWEEEDAANAAATDPPAAAKTTKSATKPVNLKTRPLTLQQRGAPWAETSDEEELEQSESATKKTPEEAPKGGKTLRKGPPGSETKVTRGDASKSRTATDPLTDTEEENKYINDLFESAEKLEYMNDIGDARLRSHFREFPLKVKAAAGKRRSSRSSVKAVIEEEEDDGYGDKDDDDDTDYVGWSLRQIKGYRRYSFAKTRGARSDFV